MENSGSFDLINFDIADLVTASILCLDSSGRIIFANTAAESLFGLSKVQLTKMKIDRLLTGANEFYEFWPTIGE